jgi:hypothetical protein
MLPGRFSLGTGFAITASGRSSSQLDLVIYDAINNAPIILEGGAGLFPIECLYGFVEVKTILDSTAIDGFAKAVGTVRSFAPEKRFVAYRTRDSSEGHGVVDDMELADPLPPRSFLFAIKSAYGDIASLVTDLTSATEKHQAHIHGLAVMERGWLIRQKAYRNPHEFVCWKGEPLAPFCATVLDTIQSITMRPASMKRYLGLAET